MKQNRILLIFLLAVLAGMPSLVAQDNLSPYSRYGYGNMRDNTTSAQRAMGGVGYAMQSGRQINVMNPASYAAVDSLTFLFDMGMNFSSFKASDAGNKTSNYGGGLDYITMLFPVSKIVGVSAGLLPYTSTGYAFGDEISHGSSTFQGTGGINLLYAGVGVKPLIPGLTVGANIAYMFGTTRNDNYVTTSAGSTSLFEREMEVRDYYLQFGVQYGLDIARDKKITVGVTYSPAKSLHGTARAMIQDVTVAQGPDTVQTVGLNGNYGMAASYGIGLGFSLAERLKVEFDYTYQPWKNVKYTTLEGYEGTRFDDRWKVALGAEYTINPRGNYFQRINFRAGAYYDRDYVMIGDNHVIKRGLTCGFGLPAPKSKTVVNLGLEYFQRKATPNTLVKENYLMVTIGINFNQLWFMKSKIR